MIQQTISRQAALDSYSTFLAVTLALYRESFSPSLARTFAGYARELAETLSAYGAQEEGADHE